MPDPVRSPYSRVFVIENGVGPANVPTYEGQARAMGPSWAFGDRTPVREPDPDRYGSFRIIDAIKGERELPNLTIENRYQYTLSTFLEIGRRACPFDVQIHFGRCQDPRDFNGGWDKILALEGADLTNWATNELGALEQGQDAIVNETIDMDGLDMFEIMQVGFAELGAAEVVDEIADIVICDAISCGACGLPSDGCSVFFAIQVAAVGSPGLAAELIYSNDGGGTIGETNITTLPVSSDASALACVSTRLAVASATDEAIHYALLDEIIEGTETWARNGGGIETGDGPTCLYSAGAAYTWGGGIDGRIYFWSDITADATLQATVGAEDYNAIDGLDDQVVVVVGDSNQIARTVNGGDSWETLTGPSVGNHLTAVAVRGEDVYLVGNDDGELWYTLDGGTTWTRKRFPSDDAGSTVEDISFATSTVGYLAHTLSGAGRILRTIDGGNSWYELPEGTGSIPTNQRINALDACGEDPNVAYGGGLGAGTDGIVLKVA